jgi:hypothetical protein
MSLTPPAEVQDWCQELRALTRSAFGIPVLAQLGTVHVTGGEIELATAGPDVATCTAMKGSSVVVALVLATMSLWGCSGDSKSDHRGSDAGGSTSAGSTSSGGGSTTGGTTQGGGGNGGSTVDCSPPNPCPTDGTACEQLGEICSHCYYGACGRPGCRDGAAQGYYEHCECVLYRGTPRWNCCGLTNVSMAGCAVDDFDVDACGLPSDSGPCEGDQQRYWHNPASGECEVFTYGGCGGNDNNFETVAACELSCAGYVGSGGHGGETFGP